MGKMPITWKQKTGTVAVAIGVGRYANNAGMITYKEKQDTQPKKRLTKEERNKPSGYETTRYGTATF